MGSKVHGRRFGEQFAQNTFLKPNSNAIWETDLKSLMEEFLILVRGSCSVDFIEASFVINGAAKLYGRRVSCLYASAVETVHQLLNRHSKNKESERNTQRTNKNKKRPDNVIAFESLDDLRAVDSKTLNDNSNSWLLRDSSSYGKLEIASILLSGTDEPRKSNCIDDELGSLNAFALCSFRLHESGALVPPDYDVCKFTRADENADDILSEGIGEGDCMSSEEICVDADNNENCMDVVGCPDNSMPDSQSLQNEFDEWMTRKIDRRNATTELSTLQFIRQKVFDKESEDTVSINRLSGRKRKSGSFLIACTSKRCFLCDDDDDDSELRDFVKLTPYVATKTRKHRNDIALAEPVTDADNDMEIADQDHPSGLEFGIDMTEEMRLEKRVEAYWAKAASLAPSNELSINLTTWEEKVKSILEETEEHEEFDIDYYSQSLLSFLEDNEDEEDDSISFEEICKGMRKWEICRFFLASLQMANEYNVDIKTTVHKLSGKSSTSLSRIARQNAKKPRFET